MHFGEFSSERAIHVTPERDPISVGEEHDDRYEGEE